MSIRAFPLAWFVSVLIYAHAGSALGGDLTEDWDVAGRIASRLSLARAQLVAAERGPKADPKALQSLSAKVAVLDSLLRDGDTTLRKLKALSATVNLEAGSQWWRAAGSLGSFSVAYGKALVGLETGSKVGDRKKKVLSRVEDLAKTYREADELQALIGALEAEETQTVLQECKNILESGPGGPTGGAKPSIPPTEPVGRDPRVSTSAVVAPKLSEIGAGDEPGPAAASAGAGALDDR